MSHVPDAEKLARLASLFQRSPVQRTLGTSLQYDDAREAIVSFPPHPDFDNTLGGTHGGIIATLVDTAGWFAAAPAYGNWIVTVDLHVQLLVPGDGQTLTAVGRLVRAGAKVAMADVIVRRADATTVATGRGTFAVTTMPRE